MDGRTDLDGRTDDGRTDGDTGPTRTVGQIIFMLTIPSIANP